MDFNDTKDEAIFRDEVSSWPRTYLISKYCFVFSIVKIHVFPPNNIILSW